MKVKILFVLILLLSNCEELPKINKKLQHQYFIECMKVLPVGPVSTRYNDWDEVVDACHQAASFQAIE